MEKMEIKKEANGPVARGQSHTGQLWFPAKDKYHVTNADATGLIF